MTLTYQPVFNSNCSPFQLETAAQAAGWTAPSIRSQFRFADFGCGPGTTLVVLAAAFPHGTFFGLDLDPRHVRAARDKAESLGLTNIEFICGSFDAREADKICDVDFAVANGVYSWFGTAVRSQLLNRLEAAVRPGGLALVSYYTLSGAAQTLPVRRLLKEITSALSPTDKDAEAKALRVVYELLQSKAAFFDENPIATRLVSEWSGRSMNYLVNDYFAPDLRLSEPSEVAAEMASHDFAFAGDSEAVLWDPAPTARDLATLDPAASWLEDAAAFATASPFRSDVFVRHPVTRSTAPQIPKQDMFGTLWPETLLAGQSEWHSDFATVVKTCIAKPRSWVELLGARDGEEPLRLAARLRRAIATRVLTRRESTPRSDVLHNATGVRFAHGVSRLFADDPQLRLTPAYLPAPLLSGAIPTPSDIVDLIRAAEQCSDETTLRSALVERFSNPDREETAARVDYAVESFKTIWGPYLVSAGTLTTEERDLA